MRACGQSWPARWTVTDCNFINVSGCGGYTDCFPSVIASVVPRHEGDGLALPWIWGSSGG